MASQHRESLFHKELYSMFFWRASFQNMYLLFWNVIHTVQAAFRGALAKGRLLLWRKRMMISTILEKLFSIIHINFVLNEGIENFHQYFTTIFKSGWHSGVIFQNLIFFPKSFNDFVAKSMRFIEDSWQLQQCSLIFDSMRISILFYYKDILGSWNLIFQTKKYRIAISFQMSFGTKA